MSFKLPELSYGLDALSPYISKETLEYHYGKHHQGYVNKLNAALEKNDQFKNASLEDIILKAEGGIFNNAAQIWNHTFYWNSLTPQSEKRPGSVLADALAQNFGSFEKFQEEFTQKASTLFGSGWVWLVKNQDGSLAVVPTKDAGNPLTDNQTPLLTCDVWEHAYYIDYRNARPKYIEAFWNLVNWKFALSQLEGAQAPASK